MHCELAKLRAGGRPTDVNLQYASRFLCEIAGARAVLIDKSPAALEIAKVNANKYSVSDQALFVVSDCFNSLESRDYEFDLIVSNPPYIAEAALDCGKQLRVLERRTQSQDHPILLTVPETHYLKCLFFEVL